jgi:hypothetical protein
MAGGATAVRRRRFKLVVGEAILLVPVDLGCEIRPDQQPPGGAELVYGPACQPAGRAPCAPSVNLEPASKVCYACGLTSSHTRLDAGVGYIHSP